MFCVFLYAAGEWYAFIIIKSKSYTQQTKLHSQKTWPTIISGIFNDIAAENKVCKYAGQVTRRAGLMNSNG